MGEGSAKLSFLAPVDVISVFVQAALINMVPSIQVQALALAIDVTSIEVDQGTLQTVESDVKINLYTAVQTTVHIHMGLKVGSKVVSRLSDNEVSYKEDCEDREYATRGSPNPKLRGHSRNDIILLQRARERHSWDWEGLPRDGEEKENSTP